VLTSLLMEKSFCSWLCPVCRLSERLWRVGRSILGRTCRLLRWADIPLRGLKYLLLGFFVFVIAGAQRWFGPAGRAAVAGFLVCIFFGLVFVARVMNQWQTKLPREMHMYLVAHADQVMHPGM
jgi:polyferredoxin